MGSQNAGAGVARHALNGRRMPDLAPAVLAATVAVQLGAVAMVLLGVHARSSPKELSPATTCSPGSVSTALRGPA